MDIDFILLPAYIFGFIYCSYLWKKNQNKGFLKLALIAAGAGGYRMIESILEVLNINSYVEPYNHYVAMGLTVLALVWGSKVYLTEILQNKSTPQTHLRKTEKHED